MFLGCGSLRDGIGGMWVCGCVCVCERTCSFRGLDIGYVSVSPSKPALYYTGKKKDSGEAYNNGRARASVISFHYNMMIVETILNQKI